MKDSYLWTMVVLGLALTACSEQMNSDESSDVGNSRGPGQPEYVVMADDLAQLKADFNANKGRVRLVFLNGPTCGICLRGMADLNDEFVAARQGDDRLVTFVVHVPTMGAKEHHAADSIPLLDGPRVHHYWEASGIIGRHYSEVMGVDMYVWDFWAIYGPDATWSGALPPVPDYYEHQLGVTSGRFRGFPKERVLDAERFAAKTDSFLELVDNGRFAGGVDTRLSEQERLADGTVIPHVGQPRNVAVRQHIMGRGGYRNLKRIRSIEARGHIAAGGESQAIVVTSVRPNKLLRTVGDAERVTVAELGEDGTVTISRGDDRGLPPDFEERLLNSFEFDGLLVEWPEKGHEVEMLGMRKFGEVLAWQLDLVRNDGGHWHLFIDSHSGDLVRKALLNAGNEPDFIIDQREFRETSGFRMPYRIDYLNGDGELLANEIFDEIAVDVAPFVVDEEAVTH